MKTNGSNYPTTEVEVPKRPFRLWDANAKKAYRWRCYANYRHAHMGALVEARWGKVGQVVEVFDARFGRLMGQYVRRERHVDFIPEAKPTPIEVKK